MKNKLYYLKECFISALQSIANKKLRSFLTILGIVIGISSVVMITILGKTLSNTVYSSFSATMGGELIWADVLDEEGKSVEDEQCKFTNEMINKYEKKLGEKVIPIIQLGVNNNGILYDESQATYGSVKILGVSPAYEMSYGITMIKGRFITEQDCSECRCSIVISQKTAEFCFPNCDPIGQEVSCKDQSGKVNKFVIVGIYNFIDSNGELVTSSQPKDYSIQAFTSYTYSAYVLGIDIDRSCQHCEWHVKLDRNESIGDFARETEEYFNNLLEGTNYHVTVNTAEQSMDSLDKIIKILTSIISFVAVISLIVGGVGVMNVMLITVASRTKEIGICKSLGATNNMIRIRFLVESVVLCLIGCTLGVLIGIGLGKVITLMLPTLLESLIKKSNTGSVVLNIKREIDCSVIAMSFLFTFLIGVIFGFYPATKAAKKVPVDALKH